MNTTPRLQSRDLQSLEGLPVELTMVDGSRVESALLVLAPRADAKSIWIEVAREDVFIERNRVANVRGAFHQVAYGPAPFIGKAAGDGLAS